MNLGYKEAVLIAQLRLLARYSICLVRYNYAIARLSVRPSVRHTGVS